MKIRIDITRRPEIADPEGTTVKRALTDLGHENVTEVRVDRVIHLDLVADDEEEARRQAAEMCREVLANPVLEDYTVEIMK